MWRIKSSLKSRQTRILYLDPKMSSHSATSHLAFAAGLLLLVPKARAEGKGLEFNRDVRPILSDKCFACHGFDAKTREAGMRLDTEEGA